jgi:hypothetical protein
MDRAMKWGDRSKFARRAALALSVAWIVACSSVVGVDDYKDSTAELCNLLRVCYGFSGCESRIGSSLEAAAPQTRTAWLVALSDQACLDHCSAARLCLDIAPVCVHELKACKRQEDCCQFLEGVADCDKNRKVCCRTDGVKCTDNEQCCDGFCDTRTATCGGSTCRATDSACAADYQCCTGICDPKSHQCKKGICTPLGQACGGDDRCCDGASCQADGRCGYAPTCRNEGEPCDPTGQAQDQLCCNAIPCKQVPGTDPAAGICSAQACLPDSSPCDPSVPADCCSQYCDPFAAMCGHACVSNGQPCAAAYDCCSGVCGIDGLCACSGENEICATNADCCGGASCVNGLCSQSCGTASCHDLCLDGPPLDPAQCPTQATCIAAVCASDSYCCCIKWDDLCATEAVTNPSCAAPVCSSP